MTKVVLLLYFTVANITELGWEMSQSYGQQDASSIQVLNVPRCVLAGVYWR